MLKRVSKILLYLIALYAVVGFFVLPLFLKPKIVELIETNTNAKVQIETLYINPFTFVMGVNSVALKRAKEREFFKADRLIVDINPSSLSQLAIGIKNITLQKATLFVELYKDKSLNVTDILKQSSQGQAQTKSTFLQNIPRVIIDTIAIKDSKIEYKAFRQEKSFDLSLSDIGFTLKDIDTKKMDDSDATLRLHTLMDDGGLIDIQSKILKLQPLQIEGKLSLENMQLYTFWKYLQEQFNVEVADGKLSLESGFYVDFFDLNKTYLSDFSAVVEALRIKPKERYKDTLLLSEASVSRGFIKPFSRNIKLGRVALDGLHVEGVITKEGRVDLLDYFDLNPDKNASKHSESSLTDLSIESVDLNKISMNLEDQSVKPAVQSHLDTLHIHLDDFSSRGVKPFSYEMFLKANEKFTCSAQGRGVFDTLETNTSLTCRDFDLIPYKPYIKKIVRQSFKKFNLDLQSASIGFGGNILTHKNSLEVQNAHLDIKSFALNEKSTARELFRFKNLLIRGANVDTQKKRVDIGYAVVNALHVNVKKYMSGSINLEDLVVLNPQKQKKKSNPYQLKVKHIALKSSGVNFYDFTVKPSAKSSIDRVEFNGYGFDLDKYSWMDYELYARLNQKATIRSKAKLRLSPLTQEGTLNITNFALKDINPYLQDKTYIKLAKGSASLWTKTNYRHSPQEADLKIKGSMALKKTVLKDSRDMLVLASLDSLQVDKFSFKLSPNSLFVNKVNINKVNINSLINREKKFNLATLLKKGQEQKLQHSADKSDFLIKVNVVDLNGGVASFSDMSMPIPYKMKLQKMRGVMYSYSNILGYTTYMNLSAELPKSGFIHLEGSLDTANPKLYTLVDAKLQNIDLHALSPYSFLFTGYALDNGKLYIGSNYDIRDSRLQGTNNIVVNNIELGKINPDKNATHLPLGLAVGLLEDSRGVIDFNMPIEGNIDKPDFKYGGLVIGTFTKLVFSAVASPFTLLGKILDVDTDKLSGIFFSFGSFELSESEKKKLDTIAAIMKKKPKISLSVTGVYDPKADTPEDEKIEIKKLKQLAQKRLEAIAEYLIKVKGVESGRILDNGVSFTKVPKEDGVDSKLEIILSVL